MLPNWNFNDDCNPNPDCHERPRPKVIFCLCPTGPTGATGGITGPTGATGPTGPTGPAGSGLTTLGYYPDFASFIAAHPTGNPGDSYVVGSSVYMWNAATASWAATSIIPGPTGATGPTHPVKSEKYPNFISHYTNGLNL